jgi:hypothetical protein
LHGTYFLKVESLCKGKVSYTTSFREQENRPFAVCV